MNDRALMSGINEILKKHGLEYGKREAASSVLWLLLHPDSKVNSSKRISDDGGIRSTQGWSLSNTTNGHESKMTVELYYAGKTTTPAK